jgi:hypothetical protein
LSDNHDIVDRLTILEETMGVGGVVVANAIGLDQSQYSKIKRRKIGITLKQVMEISSRFGVRAGWLIEGEDPMYKNEKSGPGEPDLQTLRNQISTALSSLQEAMKTLPQPLGPETSAAGDPAFRKPGKTKKIEKQ